MPRLQTVLPQVSSVPRRSHRPPGPLPRAVAAALAVCVCAGVVPWWLPVELPVESPAAASVARVMIAAPAPADTHAAAAWPPSSVPCARPGGPESDLPDLCDWPADDALDPPLTADVLRRLEAWIAAALTPRPSRSAGHTGAR